MTERSEVVDRRVTERTDPTAVQVCPAPTGPTEEAR
jgi:hypothetical protein